MRDRVLRTDENCAATVADADLDSSYVYDAQGRMQSESADNVSRSFTYDGYSRVSGVSVTIDSLTRTSGYGYDDHHRPIAVTYPGGEVVTTEYGIEITDIRSGAIVVCFGAKLDGCVQ